MSESNGKLSSRVMNMKFMRQTFQQSVEPPKPVRDGSQWSQSKKRRVVKIKKPQKKLKGSPNAKREYSNDQ
ncbi:hypothetical protein ZYGM_004731 [Zygosaccharomyces mellis]|uniref:Uncharacterized protein n=1 Tax=Zygosaccharomyces mellis TaxID=42258 RepID=A0A4C2E0B1_9SACH|nr:hypothetical protein ZYGM_004731 [Zygosaccharomyces mellis]